MSRTFQPPRIEDLTGKQFETMELVGRGLTTKQIAHELGLSMSGATQRVETLRAKFGGVTKAELGRIFREAVEIPANESSRNSTCKKNPVAAHIEFAQPDSRDAQGSHLLLADSLTFDASPPWAGHVEPNVVPEVLNGENATTFRLLAAVGIALGLAVLVLVVLAVAVAIGEI